MFIIDGDFTQAPEGNKTGLENNDYGPALWKHIEVGPTVLSYTKSTDVPTVAESGHRSNFSALWSVTTADTTIAATDYSAIQYSITGNDFRQLAGKNATKKLWMKVDAPGLTFPATLCIAFQNSGSDRTYVVEKTICEDHTWQEIEVPNIPLTESGGTWNYDTGIGLKVIVVLSAGSNFHTATTNSWNSDDKFATANQDNLVGSTDNKIYMAQSQLDLGASAIPFMQPPVPTIEDQVAYYIQRRDYDDSINQHIGIGKVATSNIVDVMIPYLKQMRDNPIITSSALSTLKISDVVSASVTPTSINLSETHDTSFRCRITDSGASFTLGNAGFLFRNGTDECFFMMDSRH